MAPVQKKKVYSKRSSDTEIENKKNVKNSLLEKSSDVNKSVSKDQIIEDVIKTNGNEVSEKKYSKRSISSNWQKYEETHLDSHEDVLRGGDFEALVNSYSGGAGTQLQLQDERDWELTSDDETPFTLNTQDLVNVVNCIPFHKLINIPAEVLSKGHISEFTTSAEEWKESYQPSTTASVDPVAIEALKSEDVVEGLDSDLNVINRFEADPIKEIVPSNSVLLDGKTENIIDSLASCLSLKTSVSERKAPDMESQKETQHLTDDLDFLLTLNLTLKNPVIEEEKDDSIKTDVDDWLSSIINE